MELLQQLQLLQMILMMWGYGKMKMKIPIIYLMIMSMLVAQAFALTGYTGIPQLPYLVYGTVESNGIPVFAAQLTITNTDTGYTKTVVATYAGYWQEDAMNWLTNYGGRTPIQYGDNIIVTAVTGCGTADSCVQTFQIFSTGYEDFARIDFSLTGSNPAPPPSSSGSGSSGGGGSGVSWTCGAWGDCLSSNQQIRTCHDTKNNKRTESKACVYVAPIEDEPVIEPPVDTPPVVVPPVVEPPVEPEDETNPIVVAGITIVILGLGILWSYFKNTDLRGKYRWMPGMKAILNGKLKKYKELGKAGDIEGTKKLQGTLMKYSNTITKKYLDQLLKK